MIGAFRLGAIAAAVRIATGGGGDPAIDNLVLLAHFDGADNATTFVDSGPNAIALSASGTIALQSEQSKFGGTSLGPLAAGHVQGAHPSIAFGASGDFTVECWAYAVTNSSAAQRGPFQVCTPAAGPAPSNANIAAFIDNSGRWSFYLGGIVAGSGTLVAIGQWYHLAVSRKAGTLRAFVNGALAYEAASAYNFSGTGFAIGTYYGTGFRWDGYVDEFRVLSAGIYAAAFTPPAAPFPDPLPGDPYFSNVTLLLHGDGANDSTTFVDSSQLGHAVTAGGNAKISTAQSKFGGASIAFDGSGDSLTLPDSTAWDLPGDYTIELWLRLTAFGSSGSFLLHHVGGLELFLSTGGVIYMNRNSSTSLVVSSAGAISTGAWRHIAATRAGNIHRIFVDGVKVGEATNTNGPQDASGSLVVGKWTGGRYDLNGYIDDLRITKGVARYSADFTPPTAPFPDATP